MPIHIKLYNYGKTLLDTPKMLSFPNDMIGLLIKKGSKKKKKKRRDVLNPEKQKQLQMGSVLQSLKCGQPLKWPPRSLPPAIHTPV